MFCAKFSRPCATDNKERASDETHVWTQPGDSVLLTRTSRGFSIIASPAQLMLASRVPVDLLVEGNVSVFVVAVLTAVRRARLDHGSGRTTRDAPRSSAEASPHRPTGFTASNKDGGGDLWRHSRFCFWLADVSYTETVISPRPPGKQNVSRLPSFHLLTTTYLQQSKLG